MAAQSQRDTIKFKKSTTKKNLAKRIVEALEAPPERNGRPQQAWTYDSKTPHLAICVWSSGNRIWYW